MCRHTGVPAGGWGGISRFQSHFLGPTLTSSLQVSECKHTPLMPPSLPEPPQGLEK